MRYLMVHPIAAYPLERGRFACESALREHMVALLALLRPRFDELVLAGVEMPEEEYRQKRDGMAVVDPVVDGIRFVPLYPVGVGTGSFVRALPSILRRIERLVAEAGLVHGSYSHYIQRPTELAAMLFAWARGIPTVGVVDVDYRRDPEMARATGRLPTRRFLMESRVYEPLRRAQLALLARHCALVLVKEDSLVRDYGSMGRGNIRFILDPGYDQEHVIDASALEAKIAGRGARPLEVCYFGRLVSYKGVDRMLRAVRVALDRQAQLRFTIMGVGPLAADLRALVLRLGLGSTVRFEAPVPYGSRFFERLRAWDLLLAAPLGGDTPRSTWDALAAGMGVLAFDTPFYAGMARRTGGVETVPWPDEVALGEAIAALAEDPARLARLQRRAAAAARAHDQQAWLARRVSWTHALFERERTPRASVGRPGGVPPRVAEGPPPPVESWRSRAAVVDSGGPPEAR